MRTTIDEARHAVWNLRHEDGAAVDLNASIAAISAQTLRDFGVTVSHPVNGESYSVPGAVSRELLMVVREAVYNAILHGHPTQITVAIRYETKQLCLLVIDDGVGFKPGGVPVDHHYGITGMQERMERLGGTFALESEPGSGTQVRLTIERSILSSKAEHGRRVGNRVSDHPVVSIVICAGASDEAVEVRVIVPRSAIGLEKDQRETAEGSPRIRFIGLVAIRLTVIDTKNAPFALYREGDSIVCGWDDTALSILDLHGNVSDIAGAGADVLSIGDEGKLCRCTGSMHFGGHRHLTILDAFGNKDARCIRDIPCQVKVRSRL